MTTQSSPLRYHGGKSKLARWILSLMPPHTRFVEAYAGGLNVLLRKPQEGIAEWVNDTDGELINFWSVLRSEETFLKFQRLMEATPLSSELFEKSCENRKTFYTRGMQWPNVEAAADYFVAMRQSRQGLAKDYCTPTRRLRRGMNEQVSAWLSAVEGLADVHARLRCVEIRCQPAVELIRELDTEDTLFYLDPPYLHETRKGGQEYGEHEMSKDDHIELLDVLAGIEGKFILSGYPSSTYEFYSDLNGWNVAYVDVVAASSSKLNKLNSKRREVLWLNFDPPSET